MGEDSILVKGNKEGLNVVINMNMFKDFTDMLEALVSRLSSGKKFYKGSTVKITTQLKLLNEKEASKLKDILFDEFMIKDCIFEDKVEKISKMFTGVYEGKTKFIKSTIRGGQKIDYPGNVVIIGDVNPGAEVCASGNIVVLGSLKGFAYAGFDGNEEAFIAAFALQPEILKISEVVTRAPENAVRPQYPEVARIKEGTIIVEPYLPNKYI
jgi:septum site-determining protein MinC